MKSALFLCVIFVLVACYSCSPVDKENKLLEGLENAIESQQRAKRSADTVLSGIANALEEAPRNRNKRSDDELLKALAQFKEDGVASEGLAKMMASNFVDKFEEK